MRRINIGTIFINFDRYVTFFLKRYPFADNDRNQSGEHENTKIRVIVFLFQ